MPDLIRMRKDPKWQAALDSELDTFLGDTEVGPAVALSLEAIRGQNLLSSQMFYDIILFFPRLKVCCQLQLEAYCNYTPSVTTLLSTMSCPI